LDINIDLLFFLVESTQGIISNMGCVSRSQYIEIQNQRSHLLTTWTWCGKKNAQHGGAHIIKVQCAYIPHAQISKFLNNEQSHEDSPMEWNIYKWVLS